MGIVLRFHARTSTGSAGYKSGRSSERETPVASSIGNTNSAGTPRLDRISQYQTCDCVVPIRSARGFWPPATSQARRNASVDMAVPYPNFCENQQINLSVTAYQYFGIGEAMEIDPIAFGKRVHERRLKRGLSRPELAKAVGCRWQTIQGIENGKTRRTGYIVELARVLWTTPDWLWFRIGPEVVMPKITKEYVIGKITKIDESRLPEIAEFIEKFG